MTIVVHGGAGKITNFSLRAKTIIKICEDAYKILIKGGKAIDAVQYAVVKLEDDPNFNAGTGAALNLEGEAELDAAIMTSDLKAGAVAAIKNVKNPILVARKVLEETNHILLVGEGATKFARLMGFPEYNPVTLKSKLELKKGIEKLKKGKKLEYDFLKLKPLLNKYSTVGACAKDSFNSIAAATSTGGITMQLPGRVGDTPIIGAGTYACEVGGVSCTGWGESIIKISLAKTVCDLMRKFSAQSAVNKAIKIMNTYKTLGGIIAVDRKGEVGVGFNTPQMLWAYIKDGKLNHC
jgi:beta-aspartyl-peptidase (threonine type)